LYSCADKKLELYNILNDISEKNNVAENEPGKLKELAKELSNFLRETGALMPLDNITGKTIPLPDEV
jgi:LytS/YehU family sensor histidine kinase